MSFKGFERGERFFKDFFEKVEILEKRIKREL